MAVSGIRFSIALLGDQQFDREILRVASRPDDMSPVFRSIFNRVREINSEQFLSEGLRGGYGWQPLQPATILRKAREGAPEPSTPLYEWGDLFEAMTSRSSPNQEEIVTDEWAVWRITGDVGQIGAWHQDGAGNLPVRRPFVLRESDKRDFVKEMHQFIFKGELGNFLNLLPLQ